MSRYRDPQLQVAKIYSYLFNLGTKQGSRQEFLRGGVQKGWGGGLGVLPQEKKIQIFKFWCLKWPILTEMTVKYGIYFSFLCQQGGGGIFPPVVLSGRDRTLAETHTHISFPITVIWLTYKTDQKRQKSCKTVKRTGPG